MTLWIIRNVFAYTNVTVSEDSQLGESFRESLVLLTLKARLCLHGLLCVGLAGGNYGEVS